MSEFKILLVDDVKLSLEMEKSALSRAAATIFTASSGAEAIEIARKERPDLIVLDYYMPGMNGDECCRIIKADPDLNETPVIIVSMYEREGSMDQCREAGCNDIIRKPFKPVEFVEKLSKYLNFSIREHARSAICMEVTYEYGGREFSNFIHDISEGGMFIESKSPLPKGSMLSLRFSTPDSHSEVVAKGEVMRIVEQSKHFKADIVEGMGLRFTEISAGSRALISQYVNRIECPNMEAMPKVK